MKKALIVAVLLMGPVLRSSAQRGLDRGYDLAQLPTVASKGSWLVGGTAGWSMHENSSYSLAVVNGINSNGYKVTANPEICYFFKDNVSVGLRFSYGRKWLDLQSASAGFGDISIDVKDYSLLGQEYATTAFLRSLIPVGMSGRLAMYVDVGLYASLEHQKNVDGHSGYDIGTWQRKSGAGFVVNPGFVAKVTSHMALYAGVGMAGLRYSQADQIDNQVGSGKNSYWSASYLLDLTALNFGIDFYL